MDYEIWWVMFGWVAAALRYATPLLLVTLGETLTQRTGVINLGVEGEMLVGACAGFGAAVATGNPWFGLCVGALAGSALSLAHAALVLGVKANQIASGLAIWTIALGTTSYFGRQLVGLQVPPLPALTRLDPEMSLGSSALSKVSPSVLLAIGSVLIVAWWLQNTRAGLTWRAVGESASIAAENGIRPSLVRLQGILAGGFLAGLGGAVLAIDATQTWAPQMTKGTGLIAVGLVIVARWQPILALPVCILFGFTEVAVLRLQSAGSDISPHLLGTVPYLAVIAIVIATHKVMNGSSGMPADLKAIFR